jgi:hypothetical protein
VRTLLTHQQPPPTFLEVRDALTLEELTRGLRTPTSTTPSSSTSRALVAAPPPSSASPPASLLGVPPPGPSGGGGPWGAPRPPRTRWWGSRDAHPGSDPPSHSSSRRYALANRLPPVVRAYLHVALPGLGRGASSHAPASGHGHECCLLRADMDSTSTTQLVVAGGVGSDCTGAVLQHCGADAARRHRVDRRLGCFLPHYS